MAQYARGAKRERDVARHLEADGWVCVRSAGSHGEVDVWALKQGERPLAVQVKSDRRGPFANFGPAARAELRACAARAGAVAVLAHWPPDRKGVRFIDEATWP